MSAKRPRIDSPPPPQTRVPNVAWVVQTAEENAAGHWFEDQSQPGGSVAIESSSNVSQGDGWPHCRIVGSVVLIKSMQVPSRVSEEDTGCPRELSFLGYVHNIEACFFTEDLTRRLAIQYFGGFMASVNWRYLCGMMSPSSD
jgi:hypothetical protein